MEEKQKMKGRGEDKGRELNDYEMGMIIVEMVSEEVETRKEKDGEGIQ